MDLTTLAGTLRGQAQKTGAITFDSDFVVQADQDGLRAAFMLDSGAYLTVSGVATADIPDPSNSELKVSAGALSVFGQSKLPVQMLFTVDGTEQLHFVVQVQLPAGWQFHDSFPALTLFPFDGLTPSSASFLYANAPDDSYAPWPDQPQQTVSLLAGLNFASWMDLNISSPAMTLLGSILNAAGVKYRTVGPFAPTPGAPYPVTSLTMSLSATSFPITSGLSIGGLGFQVVVSAPADGLQTIALRLAASKDDLEFGVELFGSDQALAFFAAPAPGKTFGVDQILALPGGGGFQNYIPQEVEDGFKACGLKNFEITLGEGSAVGYIGLLIGSADGYTWRVIPKVLVLENLALDLGLLSPGATGSSTFVSVAATCKLFPSIFTGDFNFKIELDKPPQGKWEIANISGEYSGTVKLSDLVGAILGHSTGVPDALSDIVFSDFGVQATKQDGGYTYALHAHCSVGFPIAGTQVLSTLSVVANYSPTGYTAVLQGALSVGEENFLLELDLGNSTTTSTTSIVLTADWSATGTAYLQFQDIAEAFGLGSNVLPTIPPDLDLDLKSAVLEYDFTNSTLLIGFDSANYGSAIVAAVENPDNANKWQLFFGLGINKPIPLTNIPLVHTFVPPEDQVEIDSIQVVVASYAFPHTLVGTVNNLITKLVDKLNTPYPAIPDNNEQGVSAGVGFSMNFKVGSESIPLMFDAGQSQALGAARARPPVTLLATLAPSSAVGQTTSSDGVAWFNLQKTFGPVTIQKLGVRYASGSLEVLTNMSLSASGLGVGLVGFGVKSPITTFQPSFEIQGIDVSYVGAGVDVVGGLLGTIDPLNFVGELMVTAEGFGIAALGGYTTIDGSPSMFLYAVLDAPLGGPAFFFVTGLALGFGYNRQLLVPDVSGIAAFPLVEWAQGLNNPPGMKLGGDSNDITTQVNQVLQRLAGAGIVTPALGEDWLAGGVKFTSFDLAQSFVLVTVKFGTEFEIDILGLSAIAIPVGEPVIYAELQLLASIRPAEGFAGISGELTQRSYLLSPDCHLTGGFAFYIWYGGPNQGDFVITLGGYNPKFSPPDFYPKVPRLGINWKVSDDLLVKGDEYFAVTSSAVMAGGGLSATWSSGGISAWFSIQVDFLMVYQPFHYYLDGSVDIGASFRINLLFTHITVSIHVGAAVSIWGPPFTGEATVDLDIISFTIHFGSGTQNNDTTVKWPDFVSSMLPGGSSTQALTRLAGAASDPGGISLSISSGLIKKLSDDPAVLDFVMNGEQFEVVVTCAIPIKESVSKGNLFSGLVELAPDDAQPHDANGKLIVPNEDFGVGPTAIQNLVFLPNLSVSVNLSNPTSNTDGAVMLQGVRVLSNVPRSLWEYRQFDSHGTPILTDPVNDTTIPKVVTGYRIVPITPAPDRTLPVNIVYLQSTIAPALQHFWWSAPVVPSDGNLGEATVADSIMSATAVANRKPLLGALSQFMPYLNTVIDVSELADAASSDLLAEPVLSLLA